jgi:deferrochelatase/peroxidase EfeB
LLAGDSNHTLFSFGFEDGISQPLLEGIDDIDRPGVLDKKFMHTEQNVITAMDPPPDPHPKPDAQGDPDKRPKWMLEGSFLVFRKLEQNVEGFNDLLTKNYDKVKCATDVVFGARLMGRWKSGRYQAASTIPIFYRGMIELI